MAAPPSASLISAWIEQLQKDEATAEAALQNILSRMEVLQEELLNAQMADGGEVRVRADLADIAQRLRDGGGIEALSELVGANVERPDVQQGALLLVGNVASEALDPSGVSATRARLTACSFLDVLLPSVFSQDYETRLYALGALMNSACAGDPDAVPALNAAGVDSWLHDLAECGDHQ
jgi:hypothetical protein